MHSRTTIHLFIPFIVAGACGLLTGRTTLADPPAPASVKCVRLEGEKLSVTVSQPPAGVTGIYYRWWSSTSTKGVPKPTDSLAREFVVEGLRRYWAYTFEVQFRDKDGYSRGTLVAIPPAPFPLGLKIDLEDLARRGWGIRRDPALPSPLIVVVNEDFDGDRMTVCQVLVYRKDGTAEVDTDGKVLGFRVEVKLPKGGRRVPVPLDDLVAEALKRIGKPAPRPNGATDLVLVWVPEGKSFLERKQVISQGRYGFYIVEPEFVTRH